MNKSRQWALMAAVLVVALGIGVGTVSWRLQSKPAHSHEEQSTREPVPSQLQTSNTSEEAGEANPDLAPLIIDSIVEEERKRISTAEDLTRKGLPLSPSPRKVVVEFTASRSLEEVARDLGDITVMELCRNREGGIIGDRFFWATSLPTNVMVLRLIEAGREDPDRVSDILKRAIEKKVEQLAEIRKKQGDGPTSRFNLLHEAIPAQFAIAGAFYVLANIDRLEDSTLLETWMVAPQPLEDETGVMKIWLIDHYFRSTSAASSPHAAK